MITLDKQIEYMKSEVDWYQGKVLSGKDWHDTLKICEAILETLEYVNASRQAQIPIP